MTDRITKSNVAGAFKRLHRAMEWPSGPAYLNGKPVVGAVYLSEGFRSFSIEIIVNDMGGVHTPFTPWNSRRDAFEAMASMAQAVETFKRTRGDSLAA